ncbi:MAG: hypothetical protein P4N41_15695 [Negativicutes bacterium]|nr:hypothetical protein [Negativicutes bacterium]
MQEFGDIKSYTLMPEEIEALLFADFGEKLQPVDKVMLAKHRQQQHQQQVTLEAYKARFQNAKSQTQQTSR